MWLMRRFQMQMFKLHALALVMLLAAAPALAESLYSWRSDDGTYSFTDDQKRIPERYRADAKRKRVDGFEAYERFSPQDDLDHDSYEHDLYARLERLRELNALLDEVEYRKAMAKKGVSNGGGGGPEAIVQVNSRTALRVPTNAMADDEGPLIVEDVRVRRRGKIYTQHNTVVRQGDKVIMMVRPDPHIMAGPSEYLDEPALLDGHRGGYDRVP